MSLGNNLSRIPYTCGCLCRCLRTGRNPCSTCDIARLSMRDNTQYRTRGIFAFQWRCFYQHTGCSQCLHIACSIFLETSNNLMHTISTWRHHLHHTRMSDIQNHRHGTIQDLTGSMQYHSNLLDKICIPKNPSSNLRKVGQCMARIHRTPWRGAYRRCDHQRCPGCRSG